MRIKSLTDYILSKTREKRLLIKIEEKMVWGYFPLDVNIARWRQQKTIIKKSKHQTCLVDISANVTQRNVAAIHPLDEGQTD